MRTERAWADLERLKELVDKGEAVPMDRDGGGLGACPESIEGYPPDALPSPSPDEGEGETEPVLPAIEGSSPKEGEGFDRNS